MWAFRHEVKAAILAGKAKGLYPLEKGGVYYTRGRFTNDRMIEMTGKESLPIVCGSSRLAALYVIRAHQEDHRREVQNILARTCRSVWILGGRRVAKKAIQSCAWCRRQNKVPMEQLMAKLPPQVFQKAAPFTSVCLDLFGRFSMRSKISVIVFDFLVDQD